MTTHNDTTVKPDKGECDTLYTEHHHEDEITKKKLNMCESERSRLDMTGGIDRRGMYVRRT